MTVYAILMVIALLSIGGYLVRGTFSDPQNDRIGQRLKAVASEAGPPPPEEAAIRHRSAAAAPVLVIQRTLLLAEFAPRRRTVVALGIAAAVIIAIAAAAFGPKPAALAVLALAGAGAVVLRSQAMRKRRLFLELLPVFIDRLHQMLSAGSSLVIAFEKALNYSGPLVQAYLRPVAARLAHGANLAESLSLQGYRLGIPQLAMLSVIVHANLRFGGSLGETLSHVVAMLNDQLRVQREFDAMTAEMRSSAKVLIFLPLIVVGALLILNPGYLSFFVETPRGRTLIMGAGGMAVLGVIVLRAMSRIEA